MESDSMSSMVLATEQIINNCIEEELDLRNIPMFDIEYMLLQIRSKSIGEVVKPVTTCKECGHQQEISIDISSAAVTGEIKSDDGNKIEINDNIGVVMSYPTINSMLKTLEKDNPEEESLVEDLVTSIVCNMKYIYDSDDVYNCNECKEEELVKFVESLTKDQFGKIVEFFNTIPRVSIKKDYECDKCGSKEEILIEGMQNFFG